MANPQGKAATLKMAELFDEWLDAQFTLGFLRKDPHYQARRTVCWFLTGSPTAFNLEPVEIPIIRPNYSAERARVAFTAGLPVICHHDKITIDPSEA